MKKVITLSLLAVIILCCFAFTGCGVTPNSENSYIVSIYKAVAEQKDNGEVVFKGFELKRSLQVIRTQCFEITEYEEIEDENGNTKLGKYEYTNLPSQKMVLEGKKILIFPEEDTTIFVRERQKKSITFYYDGEKVASTLSKADKKLYDEYFTDTYNESFELTASQIETVIGEVEDDIIVELYTNKDFKGEPFATETFECRYGSLSGELNFQLIKSTNVYVKVITDAE